MNESLIILLLAFVLDLYLGDPVYSLHPVRLIGSLIKQFEILLENKKQLTFTGGILLLTLVLLVIISIYLALRFLVSGYSLLLNIFVVYSCISMQDLIKHGKAVLTSLGTFFLMDSDFSTEYWCDYKSTRGICGLTNCTARTVLQVEFDLSVSVGFDCD